MAVSLCLLAGALVVPLGSDVVELSWMHSVEKIEWSERWQAEAGSLRLREARVRGSGAGMDIPDGAVLRDGAWAFVPALAPIERLTLRRSGATADWRICVAGRCQSIGDLLPAEADPIELAPCPAR